MPLPTQPLRDEIKDLFPHIETLRAAADSVGTDTPSDLRTRIDKAHEFLTRRLIPHTHAEDKALYPAVAKAMGAARATATMSRDHIEVNRLTEGVGRMRARLAKGALSATEANDLRLMLYGLYVLVRVHFAKEEEIYLPLLDERLMPVETRQVFAAMEKAAREARASV